MVIADMNTEKIAVFAMVTMVPWTLWKMILIFREQAPHAKASLLNFKNQSAGFFSGIIYGKYFFQTVHKMD